MTRWLIEMEPEIADIAGESVTIDQELDSMKTTALDQETVRVHVIVPDSVVVLYIEGETIALVQECNYYREPNN